MDRICETWGRELKCDLSMRHEGEDFWRPTTTEATRNIRKQIDGEKHLVSRSTNRGDGELTRIEWLTQSRAFFFCLFDVRKWKSVVAHLPANSSTRVKSRAHLRRHRQKNFIKISSGQQRAAHKNESTLRASSKFIKCAAGKLCWMVMDDFSSAKCHMKIWRMFDVWDLSLCCKGAATKHPIWKVESVVILLSHNEEAFSNVCTGPFRPIATNNARLSCCEMDFTHAQRCTARDYVRLVSSTARYF